MFFIIEEAKETILEKTIILKKLEENLQKKQLKYYDFIFVLISY